MLSKRAKMLPHIEVSRQEFKRLFIAAGGKPFNADIQALASEGIGSYFMIGDKMVRSLGRDNGDGTFTKIGDEGVDSGRDEESQTHSNAKS